MVQNDKTTDFFVVLQGEMNIRVQRTVQPAGSRPGGGDNGLGNDAYGLAVCL